LDEVTVSKILGLGGDKQVKEADTDGEFVQRVWDLCDDESN